MRSCWGSLVYVQALERAMLRAFVAAIAPVVMLALLIGTVVSRRATLRLSVVQQAVGRVMDGGLVVRLPARGTPDDVDRPVREVTGCRTRPAAPSGRSGALATTSPTTCGRRWR